MVKFIAIEKHDNFSNQWIYVNPIRPYKMGNLDHGVYLLLELKPNVIYGLDYYCIDGETSIEILKNDPKRIDFDLLSIDESLKHTSRFLRSCVLKDYDIEEIIARVLEYTKLREKIHAEIVETDYPTYVKVLDLKTYRDIIQSDDLLSIRDILDKTYSIEMLKSIERKGIRSAISLFSYLKVNKMEKII